MIVACITTHNEQASIGWLVHALREYVDHIVIVDEDSTDETFPRAYATGALVRTGHGGIGPCMMYAWRLALTYHPDRVVQIDAGGSHSPSDLPALLRSGADVVVGSRFVKGGRHDGTLRRRAGSRLYAAAWSIKSGWWIKDWTSGYRVFTARAVKYLANQYYEAKMHGWQAEVLDRALDHGFTVEEVPIDYHASTTSLDRDVRREAMRVLC